MPANKTLPSIVLAAACVACMGDPEVNQCQVPPSELYEKRIRPLLETDRPESCSQCHAAGVELADFVRGSPCEAMACLKDEGLVDLSQPELSVLLNWIGRAEPESGLITSDIVEEERSAFLSWFQHEAACGTCAEATCPDSRTVRCDWSGESEGAYDRMSDPGDCSQETIERLFRGTIFENRDRCTPCHFESEKRAAEGAPRFFADVGTCQVASLSSELRLTQGRYLNLDDPDASLLLLKPLPEELGGVPHEGHDKFATKKDRAYEAFLHFIRRYASCAVGTDR
jgi:hypothetical protein